MSRPRSGAAEDEHVVTRVAAHARLGVAGEGGRALADVGEERGGTEVAGGRHPGREGVVRGIQALPDLR
jgi:hypothetical protein